MSKERFHHYMTQGYAWYDHGTAYCLFDCKWRHSPWADKRVNSRTNEYELRMDIIEIDKLRRYFHPWRNVPGVILHEAQIFPWVRQ